MRKLHLLIALNLLTFICYSQEALHHNGYVIKNSGDTVYGKVKNVDLDQVKIIKETDNIKVTFKVNEVKSIQAEDVTYDRILDIHDLEFARVVIKGRLSLLAITLSGGFAFAPGMNGNMTAWKMSDSEIYKLRKQPAMEIQHVPKKEFKETMIAYFSDCKELQEKISKEEYQRQNLEEIVNYYNAHCGK